MSDHITERPAGETRITLDPPAAARPRNWLGTCGGLLGVLAVVGLVLVAGGWLPPWESDGPIDADLVQPVDLAEVFALAVDHDAKPRPWPAENREVPLEPAVQQLVDNVRHATGKSTLALPGT